MTWFVLFIYLLLLFRDEKVRNFWTTPFFFLRTTFAIPIFYYTLFLFWNFNYMYKKLLQMPNPSGHNFQLKIFLISFEQNFII